jgi:acyl-CoA synthetase (AMP-forming)/AMP-acid ligase II
MPARQPPTFTELLDQRASLQPERVAYQWLGEGEDELERWTFAELRKRSLGVAAALAAKSHAGERALLALPQGLAFLAAFFGCLYAGVVPVPVSAPNRKRGIELARAIALDSGARWLISSGSTLQQLSSEDDALGALSPLDLTLWPEAPSDFSPRESSPDAIALLQYTSGSTGAPRGVAVTHANLAANHCQVAACLNSDASTVYVSWLPLFHDMGLGIALSAVWVGARAVLMSPRSFFLEPLRWLRVISRYRATTSGGPNSAYALCLQRISASQRQQLDLSNWRVAFNGSEPLHISTLQRFAETFADAHFQRAALHPVYGLAETTLLAASEPPEQGPRVRYFSAKALEEDRVHGDDAADSGRARSLVSCGKPWPGTEIAIVDATSGAEVAPGRVGEIWIRGASVAAGYWNREAETRATFDLTTADGRRGFVRSGDLGVIVDGGLFVLGRQTDVLTIHGRTYYPHELETSSSTSDAAFVPHACAAVTVRQAGADKLVILQEVSRTALRSLNAAAAVAAIRRAVAEHHRLEVHAVVLLRPATLLRTTSGKVRRKSCREAFREGLLAAVHSWFEPPADAMPGNAQ